MNLTERLKAEAIQAGFSLAGVCPAVTPQGIHHFYQWLQQGYHGQMRYLEDRAGAYEHPDSVLPGVRSLLMLAMNYQSNGGTTYTEDESRNDGNSLGKPGGQFPEDTRYPGEGRVARYAWGHQDYHELIHERLKRLVLWLKQQAPGCEVRGVVDTAPLLEREFAQLAGLGWVGKHTLLIHRELGSWFFLAAVLTDQVLEYDEPFEADYCGRCTACLDACPTKAFPAPYVLDATRCISYLTIELRETIPVTLRGLMQDWVFGCDVCQQVCPWNRRAPWTEEPDFEPRQDLAPLHLETLFEMSEDAFRQIFRSTPLWRAKRRGLLRNAAVVLGNQRSPSAVVALRRGLQDVEPMVRATCVWALTQIPGEEARTALTEFLQSETEKDPDVLAELATLRV